MTHDQYWHGVPWLAKEYRKAHEIKTELRNQDLWLQGLYNYKALSSIASQILSKPGHQPEEYPEFPLPITEHEKEMEQERIKQRTIEWFAKGQE